MKTLYHLTSLIVFTVLSGCTTFYANSDHASNQIDIWVSSNKYDKALDTIRAMSEDHPDYDTLTNAIVDIEKQRQQYIQGIIRKARRFEPNKDWVRAESLIDEGLKNLPDAPELLTQKMFYQQQRADRVYKDKTAILLARANYLITSRPYQESALYNSRGKYVAEQEFNSYLEESKQVSRELYAVGYSYWQQKKFTQAKQALTLSIETSPNTLSTELLDQLLAEESQQRASARHMQSKRAQEQLPELEKSFYERLKSNDLRGAQKVLNEIRAMDITDISSYEKQLKNQRTLRIQNLIKSGDTLYNAGYIGEAVIRWQQALIIDPQNQVVQQKIDRAETFLNNFERWKRQP
jgi:tetratricopeptide (TPR) repeat protein